MKATFSVVKKGSLCAGLFCGVFLLIFAYQFTGADAQEAPRAGRAREERTVVVVQGSELAEVDLGEIVRVIGEGPSGQVKISAKYEGPIRPLATNKIRNIEDGNPIIGMEIKEFDFETLRTGKAKIEITSDNTIDNTTEKKEFNIDIIKRY